MYTASTPASASRASYEPCARGMSYSRAYASARLWSRLATATTSTLAARAPAITTRLMFAVERMPQRVTRMRAARKVGGDGRAGAALEAGTRVALRRAEDLACSVRGDADVRGTHVTEALPVPAQDPLSDLVSALLVLERARVEKERMAGAAEQRGCLVHDPARHADRRALRALQRAREVERLERELCDSAQRRSDRHLERRGRREPGADRQVRVNGAGDAHGRPPEPGQFRLDRRHVPLPAALGRHRVRDERRLRRRLALDADPEVERDGEDEAADEVR